MARSFRKNYYHGYAGASDKPGKHLANKKFRRIEKAKLKNGNYCDLPVRVREVFNVWSMPKDGKGYFGYLEHIPEKHKLFIQYKRK